MWWRLGRWIVLGAAVSLVAVQFIPVARTNPPVDPAQTIGARLPVPPDVSTILRRACQNCHSNETAWPWYSRIAPLSWLVVHHVNEGREEMNFSEWGQYAARRQDRKLKEICEQVERGEMPLTSYTLGHPEAKLSAQDRRRLCEWSGSVRNRVARQKSR